MDTNIIKVVLPILAAVANLLAMYLYGQKKTQVAPVFAFANAGILILANIIANQPFMCIPPVLNVGINVYNLVKSGLGTK